MASTGMGNAVFPLGLDPSVQKPAAATAPHHFRLDQLAGRFCELSGSGPWLSLLMPLLHEAQERGQPLAWIRATHSCFYPPDVAQWGIDLGALAIVGVRDAQQAAKALDHLLRSGAFGLLIADLGEGRPWPLPVQSRLLALAHHHRTALLCLNRGRAHLGSLVSMRLAASLQREREGHFRCQLQVLKDKRHGDRWSHSSFCRGPEGLL